MIKPLRIAQYVLAALVFTLGVGMTRPANAQNVTGGIAIHVFADPQDFVVQLDKPGKCGSAYFHIQRANPNFKEMVAVVLTGFSAGKTLTFFVASCGGDRNVISHGYVSR